MMTVAGTVQVFEGVLATEVVELALDTFSGMTYVSKMSNPYGCVLIGASSGIATGTAIPYYTLSGRTFTFEQGSGMTAESKIFVIIYGRK